MSYSIDLRERTVRFVRDGGSQLEAVRLFGVSRKTIYHWLHRATLSPSPRLVCRSKIDKAKLISHVREHPDALLRERALAFGATPSGMWRALRRLRISKKND